MVDPGRERIHDGDDPEGAGSLETDEPAQIYYEIGKKTPTVSSPVYTDEIQIEINQKLRYFAIDKAGNRSRVLSMDDLHSYVNAATDKGLPWATPGA